METFVDITDDEMLMIAAMNDELLFMLMFWDDDLGLEPSIEQKMMACDRSKKVLACTGRKLAKTLIVESKIIRLGMMHIAEGAGISEALMFCPRDNQLGPIVDRIFGRISRVDFLKAFVLDMRRGEAPKMTFSTGLIWYFRIEGTSGTDANMVGLRARYIVGDEMAFGNEVCHSSRIQTAMPTATFWYSGVPNGVRLSPFYRLDQTEAGKDWSRHNYATYINPLYPYESTHQRLIQDYGGETTQGYVTQVLGKWGDEMISSFPPGAISVGTQPYHTREITSAVKNTDSAVALALGIPSVRAEKFCIGWDYGYSPDPAVLEIAYTRGGNKWECYARITMRQVTTPIQCRIVKYLYANVLMGSLGIVACEHSSSVQDMQVLDPEKSDRFIQTNPGGTMGMVDAEGQPVLRLSEKTGKPEPVEIRVKQYLTEQFRQYMINENLDLPGIRLVLGNDRELIEELAGTTEMKTQAGYTVYYGPPDPNSSGKMLDHSTDACRNLVNAIMRSTDRPEESEDELLAAMGWTGGDGSTGWGASWSSAPEAQSARSLVESPESSRS